MEHGAMRDADAGGGRDGLEEVLGDGRYAVGAGNSGGAARVPLPAPPLTWRLVEAFLMIAARQEQYSSLGAHGVVAT
jgi:hypothetical protein